jgi:hypothetical protein
MKTKISSTQDNKTSDEKIIEILLREVNWMNLVIFQKIAALSTCAILHRGRVINTVLLSR